MTDGSGTAVAIGERGFRRGAPQTRRHDDPTEPGEAELEDDCEYGDKDGAACHFAEVSLRSAIENEPAETLKTQICGNGGRRNDLQSRTPDPGDHEGQCTRKLNPQQDLTLREAHPAGRSHGVRIGGLNAGIRSGEYRRNRQQDKHNDGGQHVHKLPSDDR